MQSISTRSKCTFSATNLGFTENDPEHKKLRCLWGFYIVHVSTRVRYSTSFHLKIQFTAILGKLFAICPAVLMINKSLWQSSWVTWLGSLVAWECWWSDQRTQPRSGAVGEKFLAQRSTDPWRKALDSPVNTIQKPKPSIALWHSLSVMHIEYCYCTEHLINQVIQFNRVINGAVW